MKQLRIDEPEDCVRFASKDLANIPLDLNDFGVIALRSGGKFDGKAIAVLGGHKAFVGEDEDGKQIIVFHRPELNEQGK